jgi:homoserine dehydrogenase
MGQVVTRYHISLDVADKPGVLAQVATVFAEHGVSIDTVRQQGRTTTPSRRRHAPRVRRRPHRDRRGVAQLDTVRGVASIMRVEGE